MLVWGRYKNSDAASQFKRIKFCSDYNELVLAGLSQETRAFSQLLGQAVAHQDTALGTDGDNFQGREESYHTTPGTATWPMHSF
jgi:hypothetical protein